MSNSSEYIPLQSLRSSSDANTTASSTITSVRAAFFSSVFIPTTTETAFTTARFADRSTYVWPNTITPEYSSSIISSVKVTSPPTTDGMSGSATADNVPNLVTSEGPSSSTTVEDMSNLARINLPNFPDSRRESHMLISYSPPSSGMLSEPRVQIFNGESSLIIKPQPMDPHTAAFLNITRNERFFEIVYPNASTVATLPASDISTQSTTPTTAAVSTTGVTAATSSTATATTLAPSTTITTQTSRSCDMATSHVLTNRPRVPYGYPLDSVTFSNERRDDGSGVDVFQLWPTPVHSSALHSILQEEIEKETSPRMLRRFHVRSPTLRSRLGCENFQIVTDISFEEMPEEETVLTCADRFKKLKNIIYPMALTLAIIILTSMLSLAITSLIADQRFSSLPTYENLTDNVKMLLTFFKTQSTAKMPLSTFLKHTDVDKNLAKYFSNLFRSYEFQFYYNHLLSYVDEDYSY
ncbi:hypothetical protein HELRODRAFT_192789 [Helobdella robusta]|uniref:Uncharacterized protein n=1 Tax=Helobdella robusta TaxID=6412 RepID=T1FUA7_HELRO|nr:hypothetical protein HELRODRAFT_192789 [Helobdella robusta]ESN99777.1 hypothetical protein HELRODRAFT_192789 [Helobdella robusta]